MGPSSGFADSPHAVIPATGRQHAAPRASTGPWSHAASPCAWLSCGNAGVNVSRTNRAERICLGTPSRSGHAPSLRKSCATLAISPHVARRYPAAFERPAAVSGGRRPPSSSPLASPGMVVPSKRFGGANLLSQGEPREGGEGSSRSVLEESRDDVEVGWGVVAAEDGARGNLAAAVGLREEVPEGDVGAVFGPEDVGDVHAVVGDGNVEVHEALILGRADQRDDREEADVVRREARVATRVAVVRLVHQLAVFDHQEAVAVGDALEQVRRARQIGRAEAVRLGGQPARVPSGTEAAVRRDAEARRDRRQVIASHEARRRRDQQHEAERAQSHGAPRARPRDAQ